jgi:hypothetical protein
MAGVRQKTKGSLEYLWREPMELGDDCGELRGRTVHLLCGGTMVFHDNGNLVSWLPKPGSEDPVLGAWRRSDLLAHVAAKVRSGALGLLTADEFDQLGLLAPPVAKGLAVSASTESRAKSRYCKPVEGWAVRTAQSPLPRDLKPDLGGMPCSCWLATT